MNKLSNEHPPRLIAVAEEEAFFRGPWEFESRARNKFASRLRGNVTGASVPPQPRLCTNNYNLWR